ncbi:DUF6265 family protein [Brevundimonas sp. M20]|uniref:DUF6265 family protein n=1 Tax=Brevundimonas sp. M20 TaxID=2591463 RepID=UPI001F0FEDF2|nr:DUF6265 family protein [Brevundimonas sp. M20]
MLTALTMTAAVLSPQADLRPDLGWMAGYWLSCDGGREVAETWSPPRLGLMAGSSITVRDGRVGWELARIAPTGPAPDAPFGYFAIPEGQAPTTFPVLESGPNRVVFEQAAHDFPKRVIYERDGDMLNARIEGEIDGQTRTIRWRFHKAEFNSNCPA